MAESALERNAAPEEWSPQASFRALSDWVSQAWKEPASDASTAPASDRSASSPELEAMIGVSSLLELDDALLLSILLLLPSKEAAIASGACKALRTFSTDGRLWQSLLVERYPDLANRWTLQEWGLPTYQALLEAVERYVVPWTSGRWCLISDHPWCQLAEIRLEGARLVGTAMRVRLVRHSAAATTSTSGGEQPMMSTTVEVTHDEQALFRIGFKPLQPSSPQPSRRALTRGSGGGSGAGSGGGATTRRGGGGAGGGSGGSATFRGGGGGGGSATFRGGASGGSGGGSGGSGGGSGGSGGAVGGAVGSIGVSIGAESVDATGTGTGRRFVIELHASVHGRPAQVLDAPPAEPGDLRAAVTSTPYPPPVPYAFLASLSHPCELLRVVWQPKPEPSEAGELDAIGGALEVDAVPPLSSEWVVRNLEQRWRQARASPLAHDPKRRMGTSMSLCRLPVPAAPAMGGGAAEDGWPSFFDASAMPDLGLYAADYGEDYGGRRVEVVCLRVVRFTSSAEGLELRRRLHLQAEPASKLGTHALIATKVCGDYHVPSGASTFFCALATRRGGLDVPVEPAATAMAADSDEGGGFADAGLPAGGVCCYAGFGCLAAAGFQAPEYSPGRLVLFERKDCFAFEWAGHHEDGGHRYYRLPDGPAPYRQHAPS